MLSTAESETASSVWHIDVGKRSLPIRVLRTVSTLIIALLTMGGVVLPSNRVWKIVETDTGRVLTTVKSTYGDEGDPGAALEADLEVFSPAEFAARWGFAADI